MGKCHHNLFYIFQKDQAAHPMPPHFLEQLQQVLSNMLSPEKENINHQKLKTKQKPHSPLLP